MDEDSVVQYLRDHPNIIEDYIVSPEISNETFERWSVRRAIKYKKPRKPVPGSSSGVGGAWTDLDLSMKRRVILETSDNRVKTNQSADYTQTIVNAGNQTIGEIHFYTPLGNEEKSIVSAVCTWAAAANYFSELYTHKNEGSDTQDHENIAKQRKLSNFLLDVARSIFFDIVSMDAVIIKVMNFAQKLVNADRASLFLVDSKNKQIYARIFDVGTGDEEYVRVNREGQKEIRFDMSKGIAGYVASTGEGLNIENAYEDERFNADVDSKTGYTTKSILCMPILIRGIIIGVVQMVNKKNGPFTRQDEDEFEIFAVYCGLALHHAKLYDKIRRSEQKYRVALEVLAYHSVCNSDEVNKLKKIEINNRIVELETIDFNGMRLSELEKPLYAVYMFKTLFSDYLQFETDDLIRFVLTVRKNYRRVAYHNWAHGWSVAHAMFATLTNSPDAFSKQEALALYVSCLCHDLDHRGKNNAYMKTMSTPLAAIYSTSVMERHHFNQTVTILQQDGHNILRNLSSEEYKQTLSLIKHCILATDLALFFSNKAKLNVIFDSGEFDINRQEHRLLTQAVMMTGCDLVASAKPWSIQTETVKVIFEEFYDQGDAERLSGKEPIAMMDRNKAHMLPQMQVEFMRGICLPCYELIAKIFPKADKMRERCEYNAKKWDELAAEQKEKQEANRDQKNLD
uniref:Phosphodiesterase n=1 Tax=Caenorhabditis tropicalis TaxID=1561998 RepID=A0A1I7U6X5_9PELO